MTLEIGDNCKEFLLTSVTIICLSTALFGCVKYASACSAQNMRSRMDAVKTLATKDASDVTIVKVSGGAL